MLKMELNEIYEKFCEALPKDLNITQEQKKNAFDLLYKLCYAFVFRDKEQT